MVDLLLRGLVKNGHDVTLFANGASRAPCRIIALPGKMSQSRSDTIRNAWLITRHVLREKYDVIHSYSRLAYLVPAMALGLRVIMTYQRPISRRSVNWALFFSRNSIRFTAVGQHMTRGIKGDWMTIPNGVDASYYKFNPRVKDAPLAFLGRIEEIKGVHLAIEVAKRCNRKLHIMGNIAPEHESYFNDRIKPHIDGTSIRYLGEVNDATKNDVLGRSSALLMPVLWDEPFGIVMIEALACGTPVIGLSRGSVPEVVEHGVNGFVCEGVDDMVAAIERLDSISRMACRRTIEKKYEGSIIVKAYEEVYFSTIHPVKA